MGFSPCSPGGRFVLVRARLDDLAAKLRCGTLDRDLRGKVDILRAVDEKPVPPLLPDQILSQRIGLHRPAGDDVEQVGAAIVGAQPIIFRAGVEEQCIFSLGKIGNR